MVNALHVDFVEFFEPPNYHEANRAMLKASVTEADIPNDMVLMDYNYRVAKQFGVKSILSGHNFRTEGTCPVCWTVMMGEYLADVYKFFYKIPLKDFPLFGMWDQIKRGRDILTFRPLYHIQSTKAENKEELKKYGWKDYGACHCENIYTAFVGSYLLPKKFGVNKNILYLSAQIRSGKITKEEAEVKLLEKTEFPKEYLEQIEKRYFVEGSILEGMTFENIMKMEKKSHMKYGDYLSKFVKYKKFFLFCIKMGIFPATFQKYIDESPRIIKGD